MRNIRSGWTRVVVAGVLAAPGALVAPATVLAQPTFYESEPNNSPAEANAVAGTVTIMGAFEGQDQDAFEWTVSDVDAQKRWTLELEGIPGTVTSVDVFRLEFADNGVDVVAKTRILKVGGNGAKPGRAEDLLFEPGEYFLGVARAGRGAGGYRLHLRQGRKIHLDRRAPQNPSLESARELRLRTEYAAFFGAPESWFRFDLDEEEVALRWLAKAQVPVGEKARLAVRDSGGKTLSETGADERGTLLSKELELEPGTYFVAIESKAAGSIRVVEVGSAGPRAVESEATTPWPSTGRWNLADRVDLGQSIEGRFGKAKEQHYFSFALDEVATEEVLALHLRATADRKVDLCLLDQRGGSLQCRTATGTVQLPDLVLAPGEWGLSVQGHAGAPAEYTVSLTSGGPLRPDAEAEPNDKAPVANRIAAGQRVSGRFTSRDEDYFALLVTGEPQLWRFSVEGDGVSEFRYHDGAGVQGQRVRPKEAQPTTLSNIFLMPGKHYVSVKGEAGSYTLVAEPLGPPDPASEREPNDDATRAEVLTFGEDRFGALENNDDLDYYRFSLANDEHLRLSIEPPEGGQLRVYVDYGSTQIASQPVGDGRPAVLQGMFSPGDYQVRMKAAKPSRNRYHIKLDRLPRFGCSVACEPVQTRSLEFADGGNPIAAPDPLPVMMDLVPDADSVAAYLRFGQRVRAELRLKNESAGPLTVGLETATSDYRWTAVPGSDPVEIGPGESRAVDVDIRVPVDAWGDEPVLISARAFDQGGAQAETATGITVDGRAEPVRPELAWPVPAEMLGGANAAWQALGGKLVSTTGEPKPGEIPGVGRYLDWLINGGIRRGTGPVIDPRGEGAAVSVTVELAGGEPQEVVGIILNPVGREKSIRYLDEFEVQLSLDGSSFDTVLRARVKQLPLDQSFALEEPTRARFARLIFLSTHDRNRRRGAGIGEWKVVVRPGTDLSDGRGWNLTDLDLGGHVVWSRPGISATWDRNMLTESLEHPSKMLRAGESLEWAVSFQHQRAARVARFEWVEADRATPESRIDSVAVFVALDSPVGPWTKIADWDRTRSPGELRLESPLWARYVRFSYPGPDKQSRVYVPETLRVFEQPSDVTYSSILGEWGEGSWQAQYELTQGPTLSTAAFNASGNNSRATAATLALDQRVSGRVMLAEEEDWYKLVVPAGGNTLQISLFGEPTVRTILSLQDASGSDVRLHRAGSSSDSRRFRARVEPGQTYHFKVEEPPRAVVFAFDNSGSVQAFRAAIYGALSAYAGDLVPGRDVANILPFGEALLMTDWMGEPYILQMVLNDYARTAVSSAAEESLERSSRALTTLPGAKAVVLVTDAATSRFSKLWNTLERVQPRVFTMRVGNSDSTGLFEDLMQSWARVNDGHYDYLSTQGEMDRAFDRAATLLRRPAAYALEVSATFEVAPDPGKLQVVSGQAPLGGGAVALILDASGSMLKRLEGRRRIDIAKDLLSQAVGEHIPAGTPVALRVFGHKEANSCRTDLVMPMRPLDPGAVQKTLAEISAMNLAKTPIADSLAQVESDLEGAKGTKIVVLVTDGEETCEGDPEAVLQKLVDRGIDLRLEIVGFAIADDDLKQQFEGWAEQGGGRYFDAGDIASLEQSLADAMRVPYTVFDENGSTVAEGVVDGDPLELEPGQYRVVVRTLPPSTFDRIEVPERQLIELELD